jgi:hypothetical protein
MTALEDDAMDLGHGVRVMFTAYGGQERAGLIEWHDCIEGVREAGSILFDLPAVREGFPGRPVWTVESYEPLTLSPSVLCRRCGRHGFVRAGRWVPA